MFDIKEKEALLIRMELPKTMAKYIDKFSFHFLFMAQFKLSKQNPLYKKILLNMPNAIYTYFDFSQTVSCAYDYLESMKDPELIKYIDNAIADHLYAILLPLEELEKIYNHAQKTGMIKTYVASSKSIAVRKFTK